VEFLENNLKIVETISLDFYNNNIKTINVKQYDTNSRYVKINCTEHGRFFKLDSSSMAVYVRCKKPDGNEVFRQCNIEEEGSILLELAQQMISAVGKCFADIMIIYTKVEFEDGTFEDIDTSTIDTISNVYDLEIPILSTMSFYINVLDSAIDVDSATSTNDYEALENQFALMITATKIANENAQLAKDNAENADIATENANKTAGDVIERVETVINDDVYPALDNVIYATGEAEYQAQYAKDQGDYANAQGTYANEQGQRAENAADQVDAILLGEVVKKEEKGVANGVATLNEVAKIPSEQLDIVDNLSTEVEGMVLDATQGKILNDLIMSLQEQINSIRNIYYGTEDPNVVEPNNGETKDGDVYMLIIEDSAEMVGE
jgi:hypothetical protein